MVIGDEINRASPKTQSALLEVMEERQITIDGVNYHFDDAEVARDWLYEFQPHATLGN